MPPEPDAPGPGQYDLVNYEGPPKQYATSSMFVSTTNRWTGKRLNSLPGPGKFFGCIVFLLLQTILLLQIQTNNLTQFQQTADIH